MLLKRQLFHTFFLFCVMGRIVVKNEKEKRFKFFIFIFVLFRQDSKYFISWSVLRRHITINVLSTLLNKLYFIHSSISYDSQLLLPLQVI